MTTPHSNDPALARIEDAAREARLAGNYEPVSSFHQIDLARIITSSRAFYAIDLAESHMSSGLWFTEGVPYGSGYRVARRFMPWTQIASVEVIQYTPAAEPDHAPF